MDTLVATVLEKEIDRQIEERKDEIVGALLSSCEETDSIETVCAKMVVGAIGFSAKISTGLILDMLIYLGLAEPHDEEQLRKNIMSAVK